MLLTSTGSSHAASSASAPDGGRQFNSADTSPGATDVSPGRMAVGPSERRRACICESLNKERSVMTSDYKYRRVVVVLWVGKRLSPGAVDASPKTVGPSERRRACICGSSKKNEGTYKLVV